VTIFSYGQTGAGKTFTMFGTEEQPGIAPRTIEELFEKIGVTSPGCSVSVSGSIVELHNNHLVDLLSNVQSSHRRSGPKLEIRHGSDGTVHVDNLIKESVVDAAQLMDLLHRGIAQRQVSANALSIESSRSHLIFSIEVECVNHVGETSRGKILLCDLAGSERLKKSEATGEQMKEAIEINKSLTALGDVIEAVVGKQSHVPYRNSKLTELMRDSLGGSAKTLMFVNCSPGTSSLHETAMALQVAGRAKKIKNLGALHL